MSSDRSQRPFLSGRPGSVGSALPSRSNFRPRGRSNTSGDSSHGSQANAQTTGQIATPQNISSSYRGTGQRYYNSAPQYSRENFSGGHYKSNRGRNGSYYSSRDSYNPDSTQQETMTTPGQQPASRSYHSRSKWNNSSYYQSRYAPRPEVWNDSRSAPRSRYSSTSTAPYFGSGSRQNSMNNISATNNYAEEDFYDHSRSSSYAPNLHRDSDKTERGTYANSLYSKRTDRTASSGNGSYQSYQDRVYRRESRPSLIPKDFKDDYNDEEDEELERQLKSSLHQTDTQHPDVNDIGFKYDDDNNNNDDDNKDDELQVKNDVKLTHIEEDVLVPEHQKEDTHVDRNNIDQDMEMEVADLENNHKEAEKLQEIQADQLITKEEPSDRDEEESDNYDPEADQGLSEDIADNIEGGNVFPMKHNHHADIVAAQLDSKAQEGLNTSSSLAELEEVEDKRIKKKHVTLDLQAVDSDIFPLPRLEDKLWEYKHRFRKDIVSDLPHLLKKPIKKLEDYPFYSRNLLVHEQVTRPKLLKNLSIIKTNSLLTKASLIYEYQQRQLDWEERLNDMNDQLSKLYPSNSKDKSGTVDEVLPEEASTTDKDNTAVARASTSRRGRGDAVHSEAEFLEILKSLGAEDKDEPLSRAENVAARIPDMLVDPIEKNTFLTNVNNLVLDKEEWASSMKYDAVDNFTRKEHEMFCEAFLSYPKRFGRISALMGGLRTPEECVLHYYKTKKTLTYYKQLLAFKNKRKRGVKGKRGSKSKSHANTPTATALDTPQESGDGLNLDNLIPKEVTEEVYYTETGRRRRAAAPVFESTEDQNGRSKSAIVTAIGGDAVENERKRSIETILSSARSAADESKEPLELATTAFKPKKQRGPKPKRPSDLPNDGINTSANSDTVPADHDGVDPVVSDSKPKGNITSYWSVKDINLFTTLLSEYGQNWTVIADQLKTKSPIMVRNYYHRNADSHSWKEVVSIAEAKHPSYRTESSTNPKNPPLGVFTASSSVPSNINIHSRPQQKLQPQQAPLLPVLPSVSSLTTIPNQPAALQPIQSHPSPLSNGPSELISRSNPFSITSLLNPPENKKTPDLPVPGSFITNNVHQSDGLSSSNDKNTGRGYDPLESKLPHSATSPSVNDAVPLRFNSLNALIDAAQTSSSWNDNNEKSQPRDETHGAKNFESVRPLFGRDTPNYTGGYQAFYSESSLRDSRPVLNGEKSSPVNKESNGTALPSVSASLKNILINEPTENVDRSGGDYKD